MEARALSYRAAEHLEDLTYLIAHLNADPQAVTFVPDVEVAVSSLKVQIEDWNAKHRGLEEAQTGMENIDEIMDNAVRTAHDVILDDVHHQRHSPKFVNYFPRGLKEVVTAPYVEELVTVRALAEQCAQDASPKIQEQARLLQAAAEQMNAAFARRAEAQVSESAAYGRLQLQKLNAVDVGRRVGHRLAEVYPYEAEKVRAYFRAVHRGRGAKELGAGVDGGAAGVEREVPVGAA